VRVLTWIRVFCSRAQTMQVSDIQVMFQEFEQVVVDLREQMVPST
jgi:hypothetical protein